MKSRHFSFFLLLSLVLLLPQAAAAQRVERVFDAPPGTVLEIVNLNGQVVVQGWDRPQVRVVGVRRSGAVEIHMKDVASQIHIHTHLLQTDVPPSERTVNYEIWAPPYISLIAKLETGSLRVENISEVITVETVVADVLLRNLSGHISVETMNGSVQVEHCSGRMEVTSISGSLRFLQPRTRRLVAKTTSGDIYFEGSLLRAAAYKFYNHEGNIELLLPANASFELTANSIKGQVYNDFPLTPSSHGRVPQRSYERSLFGTVHSGEAMVQVTSFSGTIRIRAQ